MSSLWSILLFVSVVPPTAVIQLLMYLIVSPKDCVCDLLYRFIGSAKIFLRDLGSGQVRSLPSKNVPLLNEKQQAVGVNTLSQEQIHWTNI